MWGRTLPRGFRTYRGRNLYYPEYRIAGLGRGRGGLGRGLCAYLVGSEFFKEGIISKGEEKKILVDNIDLLKKEIQQLEARLNKISEEVE